MFRKDQEKISNCAVDHEFQFSKIPYENLVARLKYYWPIITADYFAFVKWCEACQLHGPIQRVSVDELHAIVKPWPFKG